MAKEKDNFLLKKDKRESIKNLTNEEAGIIFKSIYDYVCDEDVELNGALKSIFLIFKEEIDKNEKLYEEKCKKNKKNIIERWNKKNTNEYERIEEDTTVYERKKNDTKRTDNDNEYDYDNELHNMSNKKENIKRKKYGKYKRILLSDEELKRLEKDYNKDFITKQIELLDEYVQSNNNKNKYSDFNLVLRRSIRENWFKNKNPINKDPNWFDKKIEVKPLSQEEQEEMDEILKEFGG